MSFLFSRRLKISLSFFSCLAFFSSCASNSSGSQSLIESSSPALPAKSLSLSDKPTGYAEIKMPSKNGVTVKSREELLAAAERGGLIIVSGRIDLSDGCLPKESGAGSPALDDFVSKNSSFSSYEEFKSSYAKACASSTNDKSSGAAESPLGSTLWSLNKSYGDKIKLYLKSNTALIGMEGAVIKGGSIQISGASNVVVRNITIQDAYDPFPHHEKDDGFNAQWDNIAVTNGSKNIWIDHCTLEDTMTYSKVEISDGSHEKWQNYDGLCDITKSSKNVVVSYCKFKNHDKTMLVGSGSSDIKGGFITIHHNVFLNCGQRLPMTCYQNMHIFNNCYERDSEAFYDQKASIAARYGSYSIIAENNYFGNGVSYCISASTKASGKCSESGNIFKSRSEKNKGLSTQEEKPFEPNYSYFPEDAENLPDILAEYAGAGLFLSL